MFFTWPTEANSLTLQKIAIKYQNDILIVMDYNKMTKQELIKEIKSIKEKYIKLEKINEEKAKEVLESEEKFKILTEKSLIGVFIDQNRKFEYINPSFARMFGYDFEKDYEKISKMTLKDFIVKEDWNDISDINIKLEMGRISSAYYQLRGIKKSGATIFLDIYKSIILKYF